MGRHILDEIADYVVQVVSRSENVRLTNSTIADLLPEVPEVLAGLDEGDLMGIVYEAGEWISEDAYRPLKLMSNLAGHEVVGSPGVTLTAYDYGWPEPLPTHIKLASLVLQHPASQWWSSPWNARGQVWAGKGTMKRVPFHPSWDLRRGKPAAIFYTTSEVAGLTCAWEVAAMSAEMEYSHFDAAFQYYALELEPQQPVYEIDSLEDWVRLCEEEPTKWANNIVIPDWEKIPQRFSAIHLTTSGLIACQGVPVETSAGTALLHGWDIERTAWLEYAVKDSRLLPKNMEDTRYWPTTMGGRCDDPKSYRQMIASEHARFRRTLPPKYR